MSLHVPPAPVSARTAIPVPPALWVAGATGGASDEVAVVTGLVVDVVLNVEVVAGTVVVTRGFDVVVTGLVVEGGGDVVVVHGGFGFVVVVTGLVVVVTGLVVDGGADVVVVQRGFVVVVAIGLVVVVTGFVVVVATGLVVVVVLGTVVGVSHSGCDASPVANAAQAELDDASTIPASKIITPMRTAPNPRQNRFRPLPVADDVILMAHHSSRVLQKRLRTLNNSSHDQL